MKPYYILPLFFQKLFWVPVRLTFMLFGNMKVKGLENIKHVGRNVIFAPNHPSEIDPAFLPSALPFWSHFSPIFGASREKEYYASIGWRSFFYGKWFFKIWGGYPVYAGLKDYEKSVRNHIRLVQEGATLCIFPEGGKSRGGIIGPAKGGIAFLAERTDCPIVPVGISGAENITFLDFFLGRRHIVVHFGKLIYQAEIKAQVPRSGEFDPSVYKTEANYVMKKVGELLEKQVPEEAAAYPTEQATS